MTNLLDGKHWQELKSKLTKQQTQKIKLKKMSQVQQLLESAAGSWKSLQSDAAKLSNKWTKTGLLEGLVEVDKNNMSILLENQAKQLVTENNTISSNSSFTSGGQGENWAGIALPLVRKVFGTIVAKEFVSVQPMNMPSGLVFFLDFQYGNSKDPYTTGQSLYGTRNTASQFPFSTPAPVGGLYGGPEGRFTYATNQFSASVDLSNATSASQATWADVYFDSDFSASIAANQIFQLTVPASTLPSFDQDAVRGFIIQSGSITPASACLNQFTTYNYTSGIINFFVTSSLTLTAISGSSFVVEYEKSTSQDGINVTSGNNQASAVGGNQSGRGDFEASGSFAVPNAASSAQIVIPEINVRMQSQPITAKTKKLKAVWTPEFAQDLAAYQNIDAEAELTNIMSEYISMEIDLEILDMLIEDAAAATEYWSAINNQVYNGTAFAANTSAFYNTQGQWFQTLGTKIQKVSNKIHQLTLRGGANFLVTSPTIATILESIPGFASTNNGEADQMEYAFGVQKIGSVNGRYKVYKNPYMTENLILMGYRGSQFLETGAVFSPYIPLIMTPLVYDPDTFTPRKGLLTRYAKKMLRPEFYGKIYINGLNTI
jgi:hypothetical protein